VEELGWYDPRKDGVNFKLDLPRVTYWADNGALLSATVKNLVKRAEKLPVAEPAPAVAEGAAAAEAPGSSASAEAGDAAESGTA
jgi:ribosomal protein S16